MDFAEYLNVAPTLGVIISRRLATLHELGTVYGVQDVYDMLEIIAVDDFNRGLVRAAEMQS